MKKTRRCLTVIISISLSILLIFAPAVNAESNAIAFDINGDGEYNTGDIIYLLFNNYFPNYYAVEGDWDINKR